MKSWDRASHRITRKQKDEAVKLQGLLQGIFTAWNPHCDVERVRHRKHAVVFVASFAKRHLALRHDGSPFHRRLVFIEMDFNHYSLALNQQTVARCPLGSRSICFHTHSILFKVSELCWRALDQIFVSSVDSSDWRLSQKHTQRKCCYNIGNINMLIM